MAVRVENICLKGNSPALCRELDRIAQEVDDDTGHMLCIHHDHAVLAAVDPGLQVQPRGLCLLRHNRHCLFQNILFPDSCTHTDHLARVDAAGLQHFVNETGQIVCG